MTCPWLRLRLLRTRVATIVLVAAVLGAGQGARAAAGDAGTRVYVARLRASAGIDDAAATALEEAVLVAAKKARPELTVIGRSDVAALNDLVAEQAAAGCDAESCASEIADALGAPQIVTGKLTRVGSTWILSLTRLERGSLLVLGRESVEKSGGPESLIGEVPGIVSKLFDKSGDSDANDAELRGDGGGGMSGMAVGGGVALGAGVVAAAAGVGLVAWSFALYDDAQKAQARGDAAAVRAAVALGEPVTIGGWGALGTGAVVALVGAVLLGVGLTE